MPEAIQPINAQNMRQRIKSYSSSPGSLILAFLVGLAALITVLTLVFIIGYILVKGIPSLSTDLFQLEYNSENVSMFPSIINTILMTVLSLVIAGPLGIFCCHLSGRICKKGNKLVSIVRVTAETLTGIPSIVYGLFGMLFFVTTLKWGFSMLAGAFTLAIMVLPVIMRTTEEALLAVPDMYREASFGLGAGRLRTIFVVILPSAVPGILSGVILSIGRIVGETAALMYTAGTVAELPSGVMSSVRTLSLHMYTLASEGLHIDEAYATAVVLLFVVLLINWVSGRIARKIKKG